MKNTLLLSCCLSIAMFSIESRAIDINPNPRQIINKSFVKRFDFTKNTEGWKKRNLCSIKTVNGNLSIKITGDDPFIGLNNISSDKPLLITFRAKSSNSGSAQFFWTTVESNSEEQGKMASVEILDENKWHTYSVELPVKGHINSIRFDPPGSEGTMDIDWIKVEALTFHPVEIIKVITKDNFVEAIVTNHSDASINFKFNKKLHQLKAGSTLKIKKKLNNDQPFQAVHLKLTFEKESKLSPLKRIVNAVNWNAETDWLTLTNQNIKLQFARNGKGARIFYKGSLAAVISPLASFKNKGLDLSISSSTAKQVNLTSKKDATRVIIKLNDDNIEYSLTANKNLKGPELRIRDSIEQALLSGVEYLGKNEQSSTKLDLKVKEHIRFKPDKMLITMPLMAFVTPKTSIALRWKNMNLQPYFAVPDFFNGAPGGMMALEGKNIKTLIKISDGWNDGNNLGNIIKWSVQLSGLPKLPTPPRSDKEEIELCLKGIDSCKGEGGWGHCIQKKFQKNYFADYVSLIWRATGKIEETPTLVSGGGHLPSPESFFITGRAEKWLKMKKEQVADLIKSQKPDGSFRYNDKFREGHFEDTASGYCARYVEPLLKIAYYTGNTNALAAGLKSLDYMFRFRTPRGSQTWEIPLHTPDILASARLTKCYILGYKLTGKKEYLEAAKKWAMTGVPFVYLWGNQPVMKYATIAVLGATGWVSPNWIGLPVQWCGLAYADAIFDLAEYDKTFDWKKLAKGIFICGEQMQYTEGYAIGTLPDSFTLKTQTRNIYDIGPLMLIQFQRRFAGEPTEIYVARGDKNIITAPFPVRIKNGKAIIDAQKGLDYQIIINGKVKNIKSQGKDFIKL